MTTKANQSVVSVIEQEFLRVHECPDDVFVGDLGLVLVLFDMSQGDLQFI